MSPLKPRATKVGLSENIRSMLAKVFSGIPLGLVFIDWPCGVSELACPVVSPKFVLLCRTNVMG